MKYSASSLSFPQGSIRKMRNLDKRIGIEIFYEFASEDMWNHVLEEVMDGRQGEFSIHSPMFYTNVAFGDEKELIRELSVPFDLYHRFHGQFYVLHSQGEGYLPSDEKERAEWRKRATERIRLFSEVCESEGVNLVVENLYHGTPGPLFSQEEYISLFEEVPKANALIDVGHAILGRYDIYEVQRALKERLIGYHVHDNDGIRDSHWRFEAENGVVDWDKFIRGIKEYTPNAALVMEYARAQIDDYTEDMEKIKGRL